MPKPWRVELLTPPAQQRIGYRPGDLFGGPVHVRLYYKECPTCDQEVAGPHAMRVCHLFVRRGHRSPVSCMTSLKVAVLMENVLRGAGEQMGFWFEVSVRLKLIGMMCQG